MRGCQIQTIQLNKRLLQKLNIVYVPQRAIMYQSSPAVWWPMFAIHIFSCFLRFSKKKISDIKSKPTQSEIKLNNRGKSKLKFLDIYGGRCLPFMFFVVQLSSCFSDGGFVDISVSSRTIPLAKESSATAELEKNNDHHDGDHQPTKLFTFPFDGCVKRFQRYSSLENQLPDGKCEIVLEKENLFDKARIIHRDKLLLGSNIQPVLASSTVPDFAKQIQTQGWALKTIKKAKLFTEKQKCYLGEKFSIGQETGHKLDAAAVARDMRFDRDKSANRRFTFCIFTSSIPSSCTLLSFVDIT